MIGSIRPAAIGMEYAKQALSRAQSFLKEPPKALLYGLALYGFFSVTRKLLEPLAGFWRYALRGIGNLQKKYGQGSYVLITGASSGVGRALAYQFARIGFNLVLVARRQQLLDEIKQDIESKHQVRVVVQPFDLAAGANYPQLSQLVEQLKSLDISILVNNAGVEQEMSLINTPTNRVQELLGVNLISPTLLTHLLIKQLASRSPQSAVVNISSGLGQTPIADSSIYSATKAYLRMFTYALSEEMTRKVDFLTVNLGYTSTPMIGNRKDIFTAQPEDSAYGILRDLGRYRETDTTFRQYFSYYLLSFFSFSWRLGVVYFFNQQALKSTK